MAAIDKFYATREQYVELSFWLADINPRLLQRLRPWSDRYDERVAHTIAQFTREQDAWLIVHCPLSWVVDQIKEAYDWDHPQERTFSWARCPVCSDWNAECCWDHCEHCQCEECVEPEYEYDYDV